MFNIPDNTENANQNYIKIPSHSCQSSYQQEQSLVKVCGGGASGMEPLYAVDGNTS
jgi:hypothetical protein